jgi:hypothetical protein
VTARLMPGQAGTFTADCDACSFTRPNLGRAVAAQLVEQHNAGQCPGVRAVPGNPPPTSRKFGHKLGEAP